MKVINEKYNINQFDILAEVFSNISANVVIITDSNVYKYYKSYIDKYAHYVIKPGEDHKNLKTVQDIYEYLLENGYNRTCTLVGIGGGIVTDITGYVASTYMRGVKFGFIPTSLLAMVDASLGGKNGVNFNNYKNIIGCFKQPNFIYICTEFLKTLPQREYHAAFGEILKYAIGLDIAVYDELMKKDIDIDKIIVECISCKMSIVDADEKESGIRKKLNLGHTIAHAIEKYTHKYVHGEAVYLGLHYILTKSLMMEKINLEDYWKGTNLLHKYNFLIEGYDPKFIEKVKKYINKDKKTTNNNTIDIILPIKIGECEIVNVNIEDV